MKKLFCILLIFTFCDTALGIISTTGSAVSQIADRQFQIQVWQNPEINFDVDVETVAMEKAQEICQVNYFDNFSVLKAEYGIVSEKSIVLKIECNFENVSL